MRTRTLASTGTTPRTLPRALAAALVGMTLAMATLGSAEQAAARDRWSPGAGIAAGVVGGLALGAIIASSRRPAYYYEEPIYVRDCYTVRQRVLTDRGWRHVRRTVCD
jgi:hypothetical protein